MNDYFSEHHSRIFPLFFCLFVLFSSPPSPFNPPPREIGSKNYIMFLQTSPSRYEEDNIPTLYNLCKCNYLLLSPSRHEEDIIPTLYNLCQCNYLLLSPSRHEEDIIPTLYNLCQCNYLSPSSPDRLFRMFKFPNRTSNLVFSIFFFLLLFVIFSLNLPMVFIYKFCKIDKFKSNHQGNLENIIQVKFYQKSLSYVHKLFIKDKITGRF